MKKESIKKLKDAIPYLIVAQTVMLGTITVATIVGSLSKTAFGCNMTQAQFSQHNGHLTNYQDQ